MTVSLLKSLYIFKFNLISGFLNTIFMAGSAILLGTLLGIIFGFIMTYGQKFMKAPIRLYVDIIRGIPVLVTIFVVYYFVDTLLVMLFGLKLSQQSAGIVALFVFASAQVTEITRGALQDIPKGQIEAGKAIGLTFHQIFIDILLPQAIVQMIPPWINTATEIIKASTLLGIIGITDLLLVTRQMVAKFNHALLFYLLIGVFYFCINTLIEFGGHRLSKKLNYTKN